MSSPSYFHPDVVIVGAGIIGLSLALELHARGALVTVLERDSALSHASSAAAGMLAAHDPHNPPALLPLSTYSLALYPAFLSRIEHLSGLTVPFQTDTTLQHLPSGPTLRLAEHSIDPRQLAAALLAAVRSNLRANPIDLIEHAGTIAPNDIDVSQGSLLLRTSAGHTLLPKRIIHTTGAWFPGLSAVTPRKGQMLRVQLPATLADLRVVHRSEHIYIAPRTAGPQAGTALIGATVEDAGFDTTVNSADLARLRSRAAELLPGLADSVTAPELESWAGLRPATADGLPLLGRIGTDSLQLVASGHFRNGILLAPATAATLSDILEAKVPALDLTPFSPARFESQDRTRSDRP